MEKTFATTIFRSLLRWLPNPTDSCSAVLSAPPDAIEEGYFYVLSFLCGKRRFARRVPSENNARIIWHILRHM